MLDPAIQALLARRRPANSQECCAVLAGHDVVRSPVLEREQRVRGQLDGLVSQVELDPARERLNGNVVIGAVLRESRARAHDEQHEPQIALPQQGLCLVAAVAPRSFLTQRVCFGGQIEASDMGHPLVRLDHFPLLRPPIHHFCRRVLPPRYVEYRSGPRHAGKSGASAASLRGK